jgi:hypothetical protein
MTCPQPPLTQKTSGMLAFQRVVANATRERAQSPEVTELADDDVLDVVALPPPPRVSSSPLAQAARICAAVLAGALRARAVIIHAYDSRSGTLRVIAADGVGAPQLLGTTYDADDDFVASTVLTNGNPMTLRFDGELPRSAPRRLHQIGAARSIHAVPVSTPRGVVAILEVVDADESLQQTTLDACRRAGDVLVS